MNGEAANKRANTILLHLFGVDGLGKLSNEELRAAEELIANELDYIAANGLVEDEPGNPVFVDGAFVVGDTGIISLESRP